MAGQSLFRRRWMSITAALVLTLISVVVALAWGMTGGLGRNVVQSAVNGRDVAGFGTLDIADVRGNVLADASIGSLTVTDSEGVWLEARDITVRWQFMSLLNGPITVDEIDIGAVAILRRPIREPDEENDTEGGGSGLPELILREILLQELQLAEGVAGPAARYQLAGHLELAAQTVTVAADAQRIDQPGDTATANLTLSETGEISGQIEVVADTGGPLATLIQLPDTGFSLTGNVSGARDAGSGTLSLQIADAEALSGRVSWQDGTWQSEAEAITTAIPLLPDLASEWAPTVSLTATGALAPRSVDRVEALASTVRVEAFDLLAPNRRAAATLTAAGLERLQSYGVEASAVSAQAAGIDGGYQVDLDARDLLAGPASAEQLTARAMIQTLPEGLELLLSGQFSALTSADARLDSLLDGAAQFEGRVESLGDQIRFEDVTVNAGALALSANGRWLSDSERLEATARLSADTTAPLQSGIDGPVVVNMSTRDESAGWDRLRIGIDGERLTGDGQVGALIAGLTASTNLDIDPSALVLSSVNINSDVVTFTGEARHDLQAGITTANGNGELALGALGMEGWSGTAGAAFEVSTGADTLSLRAQAEAAQLDLAGTAIEQPRLRLEADQAGGNLTGRWQLDAIAAGDTATFLGQIEQSGETTRLTLDEGDWGTLRARGEVRQTAETLSASLVAADTAPLQSWALDLDFNSPRDALFEGALNAELTAEAWPIAGGDLTAAALSLDGPLSNLTLAASARGLAFEPFNIEADGELQLGDPATGVGGTLTTTLAGLWGDYPISTEEPLSARFSDGAFNATIAASLGEARLRGEVSQGDGAAIQVSLLDAPAILISDLASLPPTSGQWGLNVDLTQLDGVWRGEIAAQLEDIASLSGPQGGQLNADARLSLGDTARMSLTATAGGLDARAELNREIEVREFGALRTPGWRGTVNINGPLDTLARLYLPRTERFTGRIDADAMFEDGAVAGDVRISDGIYSSQTAGVRFSPFQLQASFTEGQLVVREAMLGDGNGGRATASGSIRLTDTGPAGEGEVSFESFAAVSRPELTAQASGNARLVLQGRQLSVTGEADLERLALTPVPPSGPNIPQIEVTELNRPDALDPAYRRPIQITLDYTVRADDSLFVSSRAFSSEWSANVRVRGPLNRLDLAGEARIISGQASLLTRVFEFEEGVISFTGPIDRTRIRLAGTHSRAGLNVTAIAEGNITEPQVRFESTPTLPEDEILARLLFDQNTAALSPLQAAQLAGQLSGQNWLAGLSEAGRRIGVDRLTVREGEDGSIALAGGRQLSEDVYLELEAGTAASLGTARIEWSLTPEIVVLSRLTGDTNAQLAIRWRREFE